MNLPVECNEQSPVLWSSTKPSNAWIAANLMPLLCLFYEPQETDEEHRARMAMWCMALSGIPKEALRRAFLKRARDPSRKVPIPGEIIKLAMKEIRHETPKSPAVYGKKVTRISAEVAAQIMEEVGESEVGRVLVRGLRQIENGQ